MTAIVDATVELPIWHVAVAAACFFLLGTGTKAAGRWAALVTRRWARSDSPCASCRTSAAHQRRIDRPARAGWPGRHTTPPTFTYGLTPLHPVEPPEETEGTDTWPLDSPVPVPPPKRRTATGKLTAAREGPLSWAWDDLGTGPVPATGPMALSLYGAIARELELEVTA